VTPQVLSSQAPAPGNQFGWSVAFSPTNTKLLVGENRVNGARGMVHMFERASDASDFSLVQTLADEEAHIGDRYGTATTFSPSGEFVVGSKHKSVAPFTHSGVGFRYASDGTRRETIVPPAGNGSMIGGSVVMNGNGVVVMGTFGPGCFPEPGEACAAPADYGKAYAYRCATDGSTRCALLSTLRAPTSNALLGGTDEDFFGATLALDGNTLAVGSPDSGGTGAVYIYELPTAPVVVGGPCVPDVDVCADGSTCTCVELRRDRNRRDLMFGLAQVEVDTCDEYRCQ